ncbi:MAG: alpha/beta hydrolase-fold protein [Terracidiphilus sp.]|nr:alpha/beta hydrolase-fold protein [Terracidiphilus sp.]
MASVLIIGQALFLCACQHPPALQPDHPRFADGIKMEDVHFFSPALERHVIYRVFLPISIAPSQQLRVVYLLHGNGGSYTNWSNYSGVAQYASQGFLLVMPDGASSYWVNADKPEKDKYADFLTHDLVADVEARFPVRKDRAGRAIVGVSMGGYGAVEYALARPDLYGFAGAISPALDVPSRKFSWRRWSQWVRFRDIFGSPGSPERQARDPFVQVRSADPKTVPYIYITAGDQEALLDPIRRFAAQLHARGFAYEFHSKPGGHDWNEWNAQIPGCFEKLLAVLE